MSENYVLNFPINTEDARRFWASKHICNKAKAVIAFSLDLHNANDNLRRYGYTRGWRTKALYHYGKYVNSPTMANVPFTTVPHYVECHMVAGLSLTSVLGGNIAP